MIKQKEDNQLLDYAHLFVGDDDYKYAFAMIKPDGAKYLTDAITLIDKNVESEQIYFFLIDNWKEVTTALNDAKFELIPNYDATFAAYANALIELFGNYALVILLQVKKENYQESLQNLAKAKQQINGFRDGSFALVTNADCLEEFRTKILPTTTLKIVSEYGSEKKPLCIDAVGFHDIHPLDIIHIPDAKESKIMYELSILKEHNVFNLRNEITPFDYDLIDYASAYLTMAVIAHKRRKSE